MVKKMIEALGGEESVVPLLESIIDMKNPKEKLEQLPEKEKIEKTSINSTPYGRKNSLVCMKRRRILVIARSTVS
ncbi:unnamed protein product [Linum trigynum]|uniref:Uncharacterized protein n=1 Tax=Linum trigynum TaxID=586398 RepID=A0AAV2GUB7_9ROSI